MATPPEPADRMSAPIPHTHTATPNLASPWCAVCSGLLDWAIVMLERRPPYAVVDDDNASARI